MKRKSKKKFVTKTTAVASLTPAPLPGATPKSTPYDPDNPPKQIA